ncbi:MAG: sugar phosphate isomerase/epimerase, partial [Clostridia bacterium]|nr:sugar phosphate isomerase/epimerase [Clostridia bacterium]
MKPLSNIILSGFTDEYSPDLELQCEAAVRLGLGHIELRGVGGRSFSKLTDAELLRVRETLDSHGLSLSALGSPLGKSPADEDDPELLSRAGRIFDAAGILGTDRIRMFSFYPGGTSGDAFRSSVYSKLEKLLREADRRGLTLCHENEAKIYGESPERCLELLDEFGGKLRAVFDMGNFVLGGYDPADAYRKLYPYIEYFHIKDALAAGAIVPPGKGEARIADILSDFDRNAERPFFASLEPHLQTFDGR